MWEGILDSMLADEPVAVKGTIFMEGLVLELGAHVR